MNLDDFNYYLKNSNFALFDTDVYSSLSTSLTFLEDLWFELIPNKSVVPTTAVVCTRSTLGALNYDINNPSGTNKLRLFGATVEKDFVNGTDLRYRSYILVDRLSHQGGLSMNTAGAQTTNLPTAALTRYTDGVGVMAGYTFTVQSGAASTDGTITITYTNQAGTGSRVSPTVIFPTSRRVLSTFGVLPLASGDSGVRSIASVTVTSSGTGSFGLVLFKPLAIINTSSDSSRNQCNFVDGDLIGGMPEVLSNACLCMLGVNNGKTENKSSYDKSNGVLYLYEVTPDNTPATVNWDNIAWSINDGFGSITSKQLTGFDGPISLNVSEAVTTPDLTLWYQVSDSQVTGTTTTTPSSPWAQVAASPGTTFSVKNGQWVSFTCYYADSTVKSATTISVTNTSDSSAVIDTFTLEAT